MRYENKLGNGVLFYEIDLDLTNRCLYVYMRPGSVADRVESVDGLYTADIDYLGEHPLVLGLEFRDSNKISILQDWIEEGIEAAMRNLNVFRDDNFEDNHWKGILVNE